MQNNINSGQPKIKYEVSPAVARQDPGEDWRAPFASNLLGVLPAVASLLNSYFVIKTVVRISKITAGGLFVYSMSRMDRGNSPPRFCVSGLTSKRSSRREALANPRAFGLHKDLELHSLHAAWDVEDVNIDPSLQKVFTRLEDIAKVTSWQAPPVKPSKDSKAITPDTHDFFAEHELHDAVQNILEVADVDSGSFRLKWSGVATGGVQDFHDTFFKAFFGVFARYR